MLRKKCLLLLLFLGSAMSLAAQRTISYQQACEDIDYYFAMIDSIHPNMYWHTPKAKIDSFITALKGKLSDPVDVNQFGYELLQSKHLFDYHTGLDFSLPTNETVFPVTELKSSGLFWNGKKILSINQVKVEDILSVVNRFKGCDWPLSTFYYYANRSFRVSEALYCMGIKAPFQVVFEGVVEPEKIEGIPFGKLQYDKEPISKILDFQSYPSDSIAIIYFNTCTHDLEQVETFLQQAFNLIQDYGIKNLFIDVSRNSGGTTDSPDLFLEYIHFDNAKSYYYQFVEKHGGQKLSYRSTVPQEKSNAFKGNLYVYQSYATCSAGPWIGEVLRAFERAVIVGTPTEVTMPVYIDGQSFRLPYSKFSFGVSRKHFYQEYPCIPRTEWGGVKPDIDYPFLTDRRLNLQDCRKIIALNPGGILKPQKIRMDFVEYAQKMNEPLSEAIDKKDYRRAEKLLQEFIAGAKKYPEGVREMWKDVMGSAYYYLACYQSLQQKKQPALEAFAQAIAHGWHNYSHAQGDSDLDFIRNEPKFKALMQKIRAQGDFLYILQQSGEYVRGGNSVCGLLKFTYMNPLNPNLVRIRRYFNLDSIAGNGDEISKIKRLMSWVHNEVRHDGNSDNPVSRNAIDMVELCRKEKRGVNCRMLAQILNECYLAMGFKSRFITCMPKVYESDCHVINAVYSDSLRKWIWMDPSFEAWVTDENGVLLGISEVRERLRKGLPLRLNEEANWNHQKKQTKEDYLYNYMAKNLYYVSCPLWSEYNAETDYVGKKWSPYVTLIPQGYQLDESHQTRYVSCDDEWFWQVPEGKVIDN